MPATSDFEIRGGYNPFQLKRNVRLDVLGQALNKLDAANEKALQQRSAIEAALADVKLNAAEDEWKQNYVNDIKKQIDAEAQFGNYAKALSTATRLAGEAVSNPALRGRMRYNESREKWLEKLETRAARKEIDSDTLARAKAENIYAYKDTYDANGNVTGGIDWTPAFDPVEDINLDQVMREIKALVTPSTKATSSTGGTSQIYVDSSGNQTRNMSEARGVFATVSGGGGSHSSSGVTAQQWADAFDAWKREHPESAKAFEQKRQNTVWRYKQELLRAEDMSLSEEDRATARKNADVQYSYLTDENGALLTPENYARSITNPMFKVMQFSDVRDSSTGGSTLLNENLLSRKALADAYGMTVEQAELYGLGSPAEKYAILKSVAETTAGLTNEGKSALSLLEKTFKGSTFGN